MKIAPLVTLFVCLLAFAPIAAKAEGQFLISPNGEVLATEPIAAKATGFLISKNGAEVTDQGTGLTWRRCVEGMKYSGGTCKGKPKQFTFSGALKYASSMGDGWRAPRESELAGLLDQDNVKPSIDPKAFPRTPYDECFWTSDSYQYNRNNAYFVCFGSGTRSNTATGTPLYLRLVR